MVTTLAGSTAGYNDGTGTNAQFNELRDICIDANNNLYVTEGQNFKIRKITLSGVVTTFAGSTSGSADGTGTAAQFRYLTEICVDAAGNIYVSDNGNSKIRKVTQGGVVTTIAGSSYGYADGQGTNAKFANLHGLCVDTYGNLFVTDFDNNKIRKIAPNGLVTTFAGSTPGSLDGEGIDAQFFNPRSICIDANGTLYVSDLSNHRIRQITLLTPKTYVWVGGLTGLWSSPSSWSPKGVPTIVDDIIVVDGRVTLTSNVAVANVAMADGEISGDFNLTVNGNFNWIGGNISGASAGTMTINGLTYISGNVSLGKPLVFNNVCNWTAGTVNLCYVPFRIESGNILNISGTAPKVFRLSTSCSINNGVYLLGTVEKAGSGNLLFDAPVENSGNMNITEGDVYIAHYATLTGSHAVASGSKFIFFNYYEKTVNGATFTGLGNFSVENNAAVILSSNITFPNLTLSSGGRMGGDKLITITNDLTLNGLINTSKLITIGGNFNWSGGNIFSASAAIRNKGTVTIAGTTNISTPNSGDVVYANKTFELNGGGNWTNGNIQLCEEPFKIPLGTTFNVSGNTNKSFIEYCVESKIELKGTLLKTGSGDLNCSAILNNSGTLSVAEGAVNLTGAVNNTGTLKGIGIITKGSDYVNQSTIAPGNSPGTLTINPSVSSTPTAVYDMEIIGGFGAAGTADDADQLASVGNIALNGTLHLILNSPAAGSYTIFNSTGGTISGFSSLSVLYSVNGGAYTSTPPSNVTIQVNSNTIVVAVAGIVLPVELVAFQAQNTEGGNQLTWQTASEKNVQDFDVEKSIDGKTFDKIGTVKAKGKAANYEFLDKTVVAGLMYYRLKINDLDGKTEYSKTVTVRQKGKGLTAKAFPNPTQGTLTVEIEVAEKSDVTIELTDILGRQVWLSKAENTEGVTTFPIPMSELVNGNYFLKVSNGQAVVQQKVVKN